MPCRAMPCHINMTTPVHTYTYSNILEQKDAIERSDFSACDLIQFETKEIKYH